MRSKEIIIQDRIKKAAVLAVFFLFMLLSFSWAYSDEPGKAANFIKDILGGEDFEQELLKDHPGGKLIWKEQVVEDGEDHFTCLVYSEFAPPGEEPRYYFYEVKVKFIPPDEMFRDVPGN